MKSRTVRKIVALLLVLAMAAGLAACGAPPDAVSPVPTPAAGVQETGAAYEAETPGPGPADVANIAATAGVPLITLNNGVQMPQFGLGTQIQSLESGDLGILNQTTRESVAAALEAG